jgi:hypothetical protein
LTLQVAGQRPAISCLELSELSPAITVQRFVVTYSLCDEQPLNAIDVFDALGDERLSLTAEPAAIFFLGT